MAEDHSKEDQEYKQLAQTIQNANHAFSKIKLEAGLIQKEISLGYRDKRQVQKLKKEAQVATQETNSGFFSRIFNRNTQVQAAQPVPQEDPDQA